MPYDPDRYHRRSIRLRGYDYAQVGTYFVTVCVHGRECVLGAIDGDRVRLSEAGQVVLSTWQRLPLRFPRIACDAFVVMPNHIHGIIMIVNPGQTGIRSVGAGLALPSSDTFLTRNQGTPRGAPTLGHIVGAFKSVSAVACNRLLDRRGVPFWQRNYWEHVIRDDDDLNHLRDYIESNPARWAEDEENLVFLLP
jgi:putative transposase